MYTPAALSFSDFINNNIQCFGRGKFSGYGQYYNIIMTSSRFPGRVLSAIRSRGHGQKIKKTRKNIMFGWSSFTRLPAISPELTKIFISRVPLFHKIILSRA